MQLTPYDEFPVHQAPHPFSYIPSTDYNWDDGYYFGAFSPDDGVFLATGARVNPNTDMIGGYALLNVRGHQTTLRFNRVWRRDFSLRIGPWRIEFVEPLKTIRLVLEENASGMTFNLLWEGTSPAFLEEHHVATHRGRRSTDQSRYSQPGKVSGTLALGAQKWEVTPERWSGARDHSWGLYADRPPLSPLASVLPPREADNGPQRSLRFWTCFRTDPYSGFFHLHEDANGTQAKFNDVFGTPFGGSIHRGWDHPPIALASGRHEIEFQPGTRILKRATLSLTDIQGGAWKQIFEAAAPPWVVQTMGYHPGSWKDGGTFFTYHGAEELALEWDSFDFSQQPFVFTPYVVQGEAAANTFGEGTRKGQMIHGPEYLARVTTHAPDGSISHGAAQVEMFINGAYHPYGFE
ncbi:hypothetical protein GCM10010909_01400 [Acidocella aquatica]|uniref:Hydroxyneurosporene synthase n=1 Tax=Acidocella aquatica TaxID=1922313 RepID=A0ABQ6A1C6_9PROT|nr:hypothetical protein [Acidocella aquatica]GLR65462.1 hypothetical protein GCM10010909_01400 [Acidocella aquatica]